MTLVTKTTRLNEIQLRQKAQKAGKNSNKNRRKSGDDEDSPAFSLKDQLSSKKAPQKNKPKHAKSTAEAPSAKREGVGERIDLKV